MIISRSSTAAFLGTSILLLFLSYQRPLYPAQQEQDIFSAIKEGNEALVAKLVTPELLESSNSQGLKPLHFAVFLRQPAIVSYLLKRGARVNDRVNGLTPLHFLASTHDEATVLSALAIVRELIINGADRDAQDPRKRTPLMAAIAGAPAAIIEELLQQGATVSCIDNEGYTVLHYAIQYYRAPEVLELLLKKGTDVNGTNKFYETPLFMATKYNNYELAALLIAYKADLTRLDYRGDSPLHIAALLGHAELVNLLLEHDRSMLNKQGSFDQTPLHKAIFYNEEEVAVHLLKAGADTAVADLKGRTPLHTALKKGYDRLARILLDQGAPLDVYDNDGKLPFDYGYDALLSVSVPACLSACSHQQSSPKGPCCSDIHDQRRMQVAHMMARWDRRELLFDLISKDKQEVASQELKQDVQSAHDSGFTTDQHDIATTSIVSDDDQNARVP